MYQGPATALGDSAKAAFIENVRAWLRFSAPVEWSTSQAVTRDARANGGGIDWHQHQCTWSWQRFDARR